MEGPIVFIVPMVSELTLCHVSVQQNKGLHSAEKYRRGGYAFLCGLFETEININQMP